MTRVQYLAYHQKCTELMYAITKAKNADYCGIDPSPFANFERVEKNGLTSTEIGFLVRLSDKMARIQSFIQKGTYAVKEESFTDACLDAANYLILLAAYMQTKDGRRQNRKPRKNNSRAKKRHPHSHPKTQKSK